MAKKILVIAGALVLVLAFIWLQGHAFLVISTSAPSGNINYTLTDQTGEATRFSSSDKIVKRLVTKGRYEVTTQHDAGSSFTAIKTGGFLGTTSLTANLKPEHARQFVGNNPSPCMFYLSEILLSYECADSVNYINIHVPATPSQPTYTVKNTGANYGGAMEGIVKTPLGTLLLSQTTDYGPGSDFHSVRVIGSDIATTSSPVRLTQLDTTATYTIQPYRSGFIAYDTELRHVYYFAALDSKGTSLPLGPKDTGLTPVGLHTDGEVIVASYVSGSGNDDVDVQKDARSSITIYKDGKSRQFALSRQISSAAPCGDRVCVLSNNVLEVLEPTGDTLTKLFTIHDVRSLETFGSRTLAITGRGVLNLDVAKQTGYFDYTFGDYQYCGVQNTGGDYLLCLISAKNNKVALLINAAADNQDSIDKKVSELEISSEVAGVSAYKNILYVSPQLGEMTTDANGSFGYDPQKIQQSQKTILELLTKTNISNSYTVINTAL